MRKAPQDREGRRLARRVGRALRVSVRCERSREEPTVLVLTARSCNAKAVLRAISSAGYRGLLFYDNRAVFGCYKRPTEGDNAAS